MRKRKESKRHSENRDVYVFYTIRKQKGMKKRRKGIRKGRKIWWKGGKGERNIKKGGVTEEETRKNGRKEETKKKSEKDGKVGRKTHKHTLNRKQWTILKKQHRKTLITQVETQTHRSEVRLSGDPLSHCHWPASLLPPTKYWCDLTTTWGHGPDGAKKEVRWR